MACPPETTSCPLKFHLHAIGDLVNARYSADELLGDLVQIERWQVAAERDRHVVAGRLEAITVEFGDGATTATAQDGPHCRFHFYDPLGCRFGGLPVENATARYIANCLIHDH